MNYTDEINDFRNEGIRGLFKNYKIFENFPIKNLLEFMGVLTAWILSFPYISNQMFESECGWIEPLICLSEILALS